LFVIALALVLPGAPERRIGVYRLLCNIKKSAGGKGPDRPDEGEAGSRDQLLDGRRQS
jgi:hypothetical protein